MFFKRILILLLVILLLPFSVNALETDTESIIRQIVLYYGRNQRNAETDLCRLFTELDATDPEAAEDWKHILTAWDRIDRDNAPIAEILPDGLPQDDSLCIIVMGYQLSSGGSMKQELYQRLEVALASAEKYPNAFILCTGGGTASGSVATEAGQMIYWLEKQGIAPERLIKENRSISTEQNAQFSLDLLLESYPQVRSLALISSDYHLRRCRLLFESVIQLQGLETQYSIDGFAGPAASHKGFDEGFQKETKNLGTLLGLSLEHASSPPLSVLTGLELAGSTDYLTGDALSLQVLAQYDSGFTRNVTDLASISGFSPDTPGTQLIRAQYTENGITLEAEMQILVSPPPTTAPSTEPPTQAPTEAAETTQIPIEPAPVPQEKDTPSHKWILPGILLVCASLLWVFRPRHRGKYMKRKH